MIEPVKLAIQRAYIYYLVLFVFSIGLSVFCFIMGKRKPKMIIFGVVLVIMTIVIFATSFLPLVVDCANSDISVAECVYTNSIGDKSKTPSSRMGMHSVKLLVDGQIINVTTLPLSNSNFPVGEYLVKAYYTRNSKRLIYIEIQD